MRRPIAMIVIGALAAASAGGEGQADWPCYRGPNKDGKSPMTGIRTDWSGGLKVLWEVKNLTVREKGEYKPAFGTNCAAAPVIAGDRLVALGRHETPEAGKGVVYCFHADTGKPIWKTEYDSPRVKTNAQAGNGPHGTPTIDGGRVYVHDAFGWTGCFDLADGRKVWLKNVTEDGGEVPFYGFCDSPLVYKDIVVVQGGGKAQIVAYKKDTGQLAWKASEGGASYSSAVAATIHGRPQVIVVTGGKILGLEPETGKELWNFPYGARGDHFQTTATVWEDIVLASSNYRTREKGVAVRIDEKNRAKELWGNNDYSSCMSDGIVIGGSLYTYSGASGWTEGHIKCFEVKTGKEIWAEPIEKGYQGTMVYVDGHILCRSFGGGEKGRLFLMRPNPEKFEKVTETTAPGSWTVSVVARGKLYVRDGYGRIVCYELGKGGG